MERPIFLIGAQRSGTTMLRYMLCGHPRIYIPPESNFIGPLFRRQPCAPMQRQQAIEVLDVILGYRMFFRDWRGERPDPATFVDGLPDLRPATLLDTLYREYAGQRGAERWGDKSPLYTEYVDQIAEMFPTAQFVHIIRDGRDVALSMMASYQTARFFYMDICYDAWTWSRRVRRARASGRRLGAERYYEVRYEELAAHPEARLREICAFLNETYVPEMAEPHRAARDSYFSTGIHAATRRPPTTNSVGRWRQEMSEADQRLFQAVAADLLVELGYEVVDLGTMSLRERARYAGLSTKYTVTEAGQRVLRTAGVSHPSDALASIEQRWRNVFHEYRR